MKTPEQIKAIDAAKEKVGIILKESDEALKSNNIEEIKKGMTNLLRILKSKVFESIQNDEVLETIKNKIIQSLNDANAKLKSMDVSMSEIKSRNLSNSFNSNEFPEFAPTVEDVERFNSIGISSISDIMDPSEEDVLSGYNDLVSFMLKEKNLNIIPTALGDDYNTMSEASPVTNKERFYERLNSDEKIKLIVSYLEKKDAGALTGLSFMSESNGDLNKANEIKQNIILKLKGKLSEAA